MQRGDGGDGHRAVVDLDLAAPSSEIGRRPARRAVADVAACARRVVLPAAAESGGGRVGLAGKLVTEHRRRPPCVAST